MAKESVQELIVRIKQEGLGNLEFLKKELKQVSSQSKISEGSISKLQIEISKFGEATKKSTVGIKGQIDAFQKLRAQTGFQGAAYKSLTNDIVKLNRELERRLGIERDLDKGGTPRRGRRSPGFGDQDLLASKLDKNWQSGTSADFASRMASLQALLVTRTFENITEQQRKFLVEFSPSKDGTYSRGDLAGSSQAFKRRIEESNAHFKKTQQRDGLYKGVHLFQQKDLIQPGKLNKVQREALNIREDLDIKSKAYADVLTKINAEEGRQTRILSAQDAVAKNQAANIRAVTLARDEQISQQQSRAKSYLYQQEKAITGGISDSAQGTATYFGRKGTGPATREFQAKMRGAQLFQTIIGGLIPAWRSPTMKAMMAEQADQKRPYLKGTQLDRTDVSARFPSFGAWSEGKNILPGNLAAIIRGGMGEPILSRKDPMGLGKDLAYPRTDRGLAAEIGNLKELLPDLVRGSKEWVDVTLKIERKQDELNRTVEEGNRALKKRREEIAKEVNPNVNQKLLPPGKPTLEETMAGVTGQKFDTRKISKGMKNTSKSVDDLRRSIKLKTAVSNKSINKLNEQRAALDKLRNSVAPTSGAFKRLTKDIDRTNKSLAKLQGGSKGFGAKGLLGFGQSVLGGAYFGGPFGALGAGVGQIFGGRSGAATGGLVGAQVGRPISEFIGGSATYASGIAKAQIALRKAAGDGDSYAKAMEAAQFAIERLNVPQEVAIRGMTRLSAAVVGAGGNIDNAAEAFISITSAIKGTAGNSEDVKAAITAMVQIFSKGKVSAEELSGQLGERFPAAVVKFAEANKLNAEDLQKRLKEGTVGLDMLSKFVASLGKEFLPVALEIAGSSEEAGARMQIMFRKIRLEVGNSLKPVGAELQVLAARLVRDALPAIIEFAKKTGEILLVLVEVLKKTIRFFQDWGDLLVTFAGAAVAGKVIGAIQLLSFSKFDLLRVVAKLKKAWVALNITMLNSPLFRIAAAVTAVGWAYTRAQRELKSFANGVLDGTNSMEAADKKLAELREGLEKIEEARKAGASGNLSKLRDIDENLGMSRVRTLTGGPGTEITFGDLRAQEISDFITLIEDAKRAANGAAIDIEELWETMFGDKAKFKGFTKGGGSKDAKSPFATFQEELENFDNALEQVVVNGFVKLEDAILNFVQTGKLAVKDLVRSILADFARLMIRETITQPLFSIFRNAITNSLSGGLGGGGGGGDLGLGANDLAGVNATISAKGNTFAKNGIVPYSKGGVIRRPTLSLMGEQGAEAILPLQRGRGGRLGVAMQGGGSGATTVNYTGPTLNFNGDEYVPKSAVGGIINAAAKRGASMGETSTMRSLQNSRSARSRIGI